MNEWFVNGVSWILVIMGTVEFSKKFGLRDRALTGLSLVLGVLLGVLQHAALAGSRADFTGWLGAALGGLVWGLAASGLYDLVNARFPKVRG